MKPEFPAGPATRGALYWLGLLASLKALSLVLMGQAVAAMLAGLAGAGDDWHGQLVWGAAGALLRAVTVWAQGVAARRAAFGVKEELRSRLMQRALGAGGAGATTNDGGLAVLATRGLDALDDYYTQFLPALVNCATIPLLLGARILFADWVSALVIVLTVPLVPLFMVLIGRYTEDKVADAQATLHRLSGHILELAKGLPVLVGLGRAREQRAALEEISEQYRERTMGTLRTAFLSALALELIATISVAVVAVFIGVRLVAGDMALEAGLLALILAPDCYLPLRELGTAHHASDDGRVALASVNDVLDGADGTGPGRDGDPDDGTHAGAGPRDVRAAGLSVTYRGRDAAAVGPLDFTAPAGQVTALAGPSGTGKSTALGVLAGTIRDGAAASVSGSISGIRRAGVAWVPQHPVMLEETVLAEILLYLGLPAEKGRNEDGRAHVALELLDRVAAGHLAGKHPSELSPGELRRVAVARGLARLEAGADVLLLDEPTAHLDSETADAVRSTVAGLRGAVTVILVAHDAETAALADHVVKAGAAVQTGGGAGGGAGGLPGTEPAQAQAAARSIDKPLAFEPTGHGTTRLTDAASGSADLTTGSGPFGAVRALAGVLGPVWLRLAGASVVGALAALFAVALSALSGWLIIRASEQPPILYLLGAIVGVRFFGIGRALLRYWERLLTHDAVFAGMTKLRGALWESLSRRALQLRKLLRGGNVLGSVVDDVDNLRDLLPRVVLPPLAAVAVAAAAVAATAVVLPPAVPAVLLSAVVCLVVSPGLALLADRQSARAERRLRSTVLRRISSALDARNDLLANALAPAILEDLRAADSAATAAARRSAWAEGIGQATTVLACTLAALAAGVLAAPALQSGTVPAVVAAVVLMQLALVEPYASVVSAVRQAPALSLILQRLARTGALNGQGLNRQGREAHDHMDGGVVAVPDRPSGRPGLELEDLAAAWPGGEPVFSGLNAHAEPGRWLVVSGPSGSGKSTLFSVLLGFLPAARGSARVTGTAAWCPQEAHLFDSTIRGNLVLARPASRKPADNELLEALDAVGLGPVLEHIPGGLDGRIGPGGSFLSGGERQRLAMARTLLTGAPVLLLDEPTAHLDAEAARGLLAQLRTGLRDVTVVMVTHNPADVDPDDSRLELRPGHAPRGEREEKAGVPSLVAGVGVQ
ncbi:thiol reductant ABC exporter subunit CydD [Pseudarthrobacter sp. J75]|uniref:thiol reductant ABC exporter subunit CydD n=1 Tax=unclassified Pseudarthrobacter TaxID=2647000 RepID=UPI002E7FEABC|nr:MULTISPECIES: thiol reductant ABC exporter subunit CydD [unclassified Pseudarthrobacter]MEE2522715.1 thiol reductant ABC exporter subunit CydD [Pseudarthrobacter sp. J47]MEE2529576.1 thiol reductant ABC exporter subunit CydD [Pseudarthrobacter sp. J75]